MFDDSLSVKYKNPTGEKTGKVCLCVCVRVSKKKKGGGGGESVE